MDNGEGFERQCKVVVAMAARSRARVSMPDYRGEYKRESDRWYIYAERKVIELQISLRKGSDVEVISCAR